MSLYFCNGCTESIPAQKARLQCQECHNYDLCANCAILGTITGVHLGSHRTALHRTSGFASVPPPPPPLPARNPTTSPAGVSPDQQRQPTPSWSQFFNGHTWQHTNSFSQLTAAIFERLDEGRTGYMTPEAHSGLLDLLGTPLDENIWKQALQSAAGLNLNLNKESHADNALKHAYDVLSIDYILRPRQTATNPNRQSSFFGNLVNAATPAVQMPLMSLSGFTELCKMMALSEPDKTRNQLNIVIRHYDLAIWRERGEIPRWALPPGPVPHMLERIAQAQARSITRIAAENRNSAARIQLAEAQINRFAESQRRMADIGTGYYTEYYYR